MSVHVHACTWHMSCMHMHMRTHMSIAHARAHTHVHAAGERGRRFGFSLNSQLLKAASAARWELSCRPVDWQRVRELAARVRRRATSYKLQAASY